MKRSTTDFSNDRTTSKKNKSPSTPQPDQRLSVPTPTTAANKSTTTMTASIHLGEGILCHNIFDRDSRALIWPRGERLQLLRLSKNKLDYDAVCTLGKRHIVPANYIDCLDAADGVVYPQSRVMANDFYSPYSISSTPTCFKGDDVVLLGQCVDNDYCYIRIATKEILKVPCFSV